MTWISTLRKALTSSYVLHLEREIEHLRGANSMLLLELKEALRPTPAPQVARQFPKFTPARTSWEAYRDEQIALQEKEEEQSGTHSK